MSTAFLKKLYAVLPDLQESKISNNIQCIFDTLLTFFNYDVLLES